MAVVSFCAKLFAFITIKILTMIRLAAAAGQWEVDVEEWEDVEAAVQR